MRSMRSKQGFSLIELLTVIAIIAILAGIIFPVMARVKREAKMTACMTNMMQIAQAVKMYHMDNRKYPTSLCGAVDTTVPVVPLEQAKNPDSLYPEYIKTIKGLHCSMSPCGKTDQVVKVTLPIPADGSKSISLYAYSSYDLFVTNPGTTSADWRALRYNTAWCPDPSGMATSFDPDPGVDVGDAAKRTAADTYDYSRQLRFRNPSDDTVICWCSNHAQGDLKAMVPVLYLSGECEKRPLGDVEGAQTDSSFGSRWRLRPKKESN